MIFGPNIKLLGVAVLAAVALAGAYQMGVLRGEESIKQAVADDAQFRNQLRDGAAPGQSARPMPPGWNDPPQQPHPDHWRRGNPGNDQEAPRRAGPDQRQ